MYTQEIKLDHRGYQVLVNNSTQFFQSGLGYHFLTGIFKQSKHKNHTEYNFSLMLQKVFRTAIFQGKCYGNITFVDKSHWLIKP